MLHVTGAWNGDRIRVAEITEYFDLKYRRAFVSIHDETLPPLWYGGHSKGFEANVFVGVYNHLDLDDFVDDLRSPMIMRRVGGCRKSDNTGESTPLSSSG